MSDKVYCDRNLCTQNEYNGIGCDECIVNAKDQLNTDNMSFMEQVKLALKIDAIPRKIIKHRLYERYIDNPEEFKALSNMLDDIMEVMDVNAKVYEEGRKMVVLGDRRFDPENGTIDSILHIAECEGKE